MDTRQQNSNDEDLFKIAIISETVRDRGKLSEFFVLHLQGYWILNTNFEILDLGHLMLKVRCYLRNYNS